MTQSDTGRQNDTQEQRGGEMTHGDAWGWHGDTRLHKGEKTTHGNTGGGATQEEMDPGGRDRVPRGLERH